MHKSTAWLAGEFQFGTSHERFGQCLLLFSHDTPEEIEEVLPRTIQQEANPFIEDLERRMKEMASEEGK